MIPYNDPDDIIVAHRDLLITDGTVTVSGTSYSVAGDTVTITNELLDEEAFELHQSLCSDNQLRYGACESNYITFVMHENIPTLKGKTLTVYMIPDNDASKMLQIGIFTVTDDTLSADRTRRTITAYDAMYDILNADAAEIYNSLLPTKNDSLTLGQLRFAVTAYFGLTQETISLPNDSMVVKRTIEPESLSGADLMRAICELEGCFGTITNEGKFKYVVLSPGLDRGLFPSDTLYPANDLYPQDVNPNVTVVSKASYTDVQFEDWNSESITQLIIRQDDSDIGTAVGTPGNTYVIQGNFLVFGKSSADLTTIGNNTLSNMENRYYRPCTVNAAGNPLREPGDGIRIATTYRGIVTYILQRTMRGIQALRDTYTASGEKECNQQLNSVTTQFKQLSSKVTQIKVDTDGLESRVEDIEDGSASIIQQLSSSISAKVNETGGSVFSFGWTLTSSGFTLYSSTNNVFTCDSSGVEIEGSIKSKGTHGEALVKDGWIQFSKSGSNIYSELSNDVLTISRSSPYTWSGIQCDRIVVNGSAYLPQNVTIDGVTYGLLVKF